MPTARRPGVFGPGCFEQPVCVVPSVRHWITTATLADLAGIDRRRALKAIYRAHRKLPWRGVVLTIRAASGQRGHSGLQYQIAVESLPSELRVKWARECSGQADGAHATSNDSSWKRKLAILAPAISAIEAGTPVAPVIAAIAATPAAPSKATLYQWLNRYLSHGVSGLQRHRRRDAKTARVLVSEEWDAVAAALDAAVRREVAATLETYVKSLYANGVPGARHVIRKASARLFELTRAAGVAGEDAAMIRACTVSRHYVERVAHYRLVAIRDKDARRFHDRHVPRIKRTRHGLLPMQAVAADVHHCDVFYRRPDGTTATPKLIAWLDLATNRLFADVVFLGKREGVRQDHVVWSFKNLVGAWGLMRTLYLDNGSEYGWTDFVEDALECATFLGSGVAIQGGGGVTRARPYNAQAKVIESAFAALERGPLAMVRGFVGGDRMRAKTHNVGRAPLPHPGRPDEVAADIQRAVEAYNATVQTGDHLKGRSPNQAWNEAVEAGWTTLAVDPHLVDAVFATDRMAAVHQGRIRVDGRQHYHDALLPFSTRKVRVRVPKFGRADAVAVMTDDGKVLCHAMLETEFPFGDVSGAREQARRQRALNAHVRALRNDVVPLDLMREVERANAVAPAALAAPVGGRLWLSDELQDEARARAALPPPGAPNLAEDEERDRRQQELLAQFARMKAGGP